MAEDEETAAKRVSRTRFNKLGKKPDSKNAHEEKRRSNRY